MGRPLDWFVVALSLTFLLVGLTHPRGGSSGGGGDAGARRMESGVLRTASLVQTGPPFEVVAPTGAARNHTPIAHAPSCFRIGADGVVEFGLSDDDDACMRGKPQRSYRAPTALSR